MPIYSPNTASLATSNFLYNRNPLLLPHWRAARSKVRAGTGNARILCIGDSTTFGNGSNGASTGDYKTLCYPTQLANLFNAAGINANWNNFLGNGVSPATSMNNDARVSKIGSPTDNSGATTVGGDLTQVTSSANGVAFLPTANVDTFKIWYTTVSGGGSFTIDINGSGTQTINTNTSSGYTSTTITASLGANTLNWRGVSGNVFLAGVEAFDSSKKQITVLNGGWPGATIANINSTSFAWSSGSVLAAGTLAPDVTVINVGINDWNGGTSLSTFQSSMQTLITRVQTTGDAVLMTPNPSSTSGFASAATQQSFINVLYGLAQSNNIPLVDQFSRVVSYANASGLGLDYDALHPNGAGYADMASAVYMMLSL
jgi:lysophospholipase L1-like esterase